MKGDGESTIGIGMTVAQALTRMKNLNLVNDPTKAGNTFELSNGNGSLMRILPAMLYTLNEPIEDMIPKIHAVSSITHVHPGSLIGCGIYAFFIKQILSGKNISQAYKVTIDQSNEYYSKVFPDELRHFDKILHGDLRDLNEEDIQSSGYVVHSLEAAIWCSLHKNSFTEMILSAVNLRDDTDTIGAIIGSIAGSVYGYSVIPKQ